MPDTVFVTARPIEKPGPAAGIAVTVGIAAVSFALHELPGWGVASPAILATLIGLGVAQVARLPEGLAPGIGFSARTLLRVAVALLGLQITIPQIAGIGWQGAVVAVAGLAVSFVAIKTLGRWMGVDRRLAELIAAGTSICGASAVAGVNTVTDAPEDDVAYAVAMVTLFGTVAMIGLPLLAPGLGLDGRQLGLWAGASIHEIAQVAGATSQAGAVAIDSGTVAKLMRVSLLAPLVLGLRLRRGGGGTGAGVPWFVVVFVALIGLGSVVAIPPEIRRDAGLASGFLLAMALAGMGLRTQVAQLAAKGWRPLALGALGSLFISGLTLFLVKLLA